MVLTPLHYVHAYVVHKISRRKLSLPGLIVGCAIPDIENPILYSIGFKPPYNRLILHSLIGSLLFSWIIGLAILPLYRLFIERFLKRKFTHKYSIFNYVFSVFISAEIHLIIDAFHHQYNPLLWPITHENINSLILFNNWILASIIMQTIFALALILIIAYEIVRNELKITNMEKLKELIFILLVK